MSDAPNPEPAPALPPQAQDVPAAPDVRPLDFRNSSLLSPRQMRKLCAHETQFLAAMEARVTLFLRCGFPLKLAGIQIMPFQQLTDGWSSPTHLVLFKTEPLRGVSVLEIPLQLALTIVERLMGGAGRAEQSVRELSEIEKALLDQIVQIILEEWCNNWAQVKPLKPSLLGCESNGRFLQTAQPQASMLTVAMDARLGNCSGQIKLAFPFAAIEPCLLQLCGGADSVMEAPAPAPAAAVKWNRCLEDVTLPVTDEWQGLELTARDVLHLKIGDVLQVSPQLGQQVCLRLGELPKFNGRLGTVARSRAVELTQAAKL